MINYSIDDVERFWSKVDIKSSEDCWNWKAGKFASGYGQFKAQGKNLKSHRVAWELLKGPISEGKQCLHKCDNRECCNVDHLYIGTQSNNNLDMHTRNPGQYGRVSRVGSDGIILIRKLYNEGVSVKDIAKRFDHGVRHIRKICKGEVGQSTIERTGN